MRPRARASVCAGELGRQEQGRPAFLQASQPAGAGRTTSTTSTNRAAWLALRPGCVSGSAPFSSRPSPGPACPASLVGAKPSNLQVPLGQTANFKDSASNSFREVALASGCPLHPRGLVGLRSDARRVRSTLQPRHAREFCERAPLLAPKEFFAS